MGGVRPNAKENGQIRPSTTVRTASGGGSRPSREPPLAKHRIFVKISASLGVIRESRIKAFMRIARPGVRHQIVNLVREIAAADG